MQHLLLALRVACLFQVQGRHRHCVRQRCVNSRGSVQGHPAAKSAFAKCAHVPFDPGQYFTCPYACALHRRQTVCTRAWCSHHARDVHYTCVQGASQFVTNFAPNCVLCLGCKADDAWLTMLILDPWSASICHKRNTQKSRHSLPFINRKLKGSFKRPNNPG